MLWSQIDANQHLRHSAYADLAAQARLNMLESAGITFGTLTAAHVGPVIFREELIYLREVRLGEFIKVNCELCKSKADGSRWSIRHELVRGDGITAAIIICDGAWMDTKIRKLTALPPEIMQIFSALPRSADYEEIAPTGKG